MAAYNFIEMKEDYLDEVLEIYNHYVVNTIATFQIKPLSREEMRAALIFAEEKYKTFVIMSENEICGYVYIDRHKKREAYGATAEVSVYLKPRFSGRGIAGLAMGYIEDFAKSKGIHVLIANISGQNTASIKMVEKCGFNRCANYREVGHKFGRFLDLVVYQKIIS